VNRDLTNLIFDSESHTKPVVNHVDLSQGGFTADIQKSIKFQQKKVRITNNKIR